MWLLRFSARRATLSVRPSALRATAIVVCATWWPTLTAGRPITARRWIGWASRPRISAPWTTCASLPLISVADLQADPERFRSRQFGDQEVLTLFSNGSTGQPHRVWHDLATLYQNAGHAEREHPLWRQAVGRRRLRSVGMGSTVGSTALVRRAMRANALWPRFVRAPGPTIQAEAGPEEWAALLNRVQPDLLLAYGAVISRLVVYAQSGGQVVWPRVVRYSSDGISAAVRRALQDEYGVQVFSGYQAIEAFKMGFECDQHNGYHINDDLYPLRIVTEQGDDCPPGVEGEIVLCNLVNHATVLLNYRMGDLAARLTEPCPCGRHLSRISYVQGRTNDMLTDVHGRQVERIRLLGPLISIPGVLEYQVHQSAWDRVRVQLVTAPNFARDPAVARITEAAQLALGPEAQVEVAFVAQIDRTVGGKLRSVINEVPAR